MKLIGAEGVDSPRVRRDEEQTAQIYFRETHISGVNFVPQLGDEVGVCRSKTGLISLKLWSVSQDTWKSHGVDTCKNSRGWVDTWWRTGDACWRLHDKRRMQRCRCVWTLIGPVICSEERARQGVIVWRGKHLLRHMSCLQTLIALSSGEAEYCALIRGACTSLGIQSHDQDWMTDVPIQIYSDSSAARSVARRRGSGGRLRHLQTRHLWLQSRVALGHLKLDVVAGERNPADTLTKPLPRKIGEWSEHVGQKWLHGSTCKDEYIVMDASRDQLDCVDRSRLVESGWARDDSLSWNLSHVKQGDAIRGDSTCSRCQRQVCKCGCFNRGNVISSERDDRPRISGSLSSCSNGNLRSTVRLRTSRTDRVGNRGTPEVVSVHTRSKVRQRPPHSFSKQGTGKTQDSTALRYHVCRVSALCPVRKYDLLLDTKGLCNTSCDSVRLWLKTSVVQIWHVDGVWLKQHEKIKNIFQKSQENQRMKEWKKTIGNKFFFSKKKKHLKKSKNREKTCVWFQDDSIATFVSAKTVDSSSVRSCCSHVSRAVTCCRATHGLRAYGPLCTVSVLAGTHWGAHRYPSRMVSVANRHPFVCWLETWFSVIVVFVVAFHVQMQLRILTPWALKVALRPSGVLFVPFSILSWIHFFFLFFFFSFFFFFCFLFLFSFFFSFFFFLSVCSLAFSFFVSCCVYEARDGSVRYDMGNKGGWCVGRDWAQACLLYVAHAQDTRGERLFDSRP